MSRSPTQRSFFFSARVGQVPHYAMQILDAMGEGFDESLILAAISETLLNAIIHGALGLNSGADRDPVEFAHKIAEAESKVGPSVGITVKVYRDPEDPADVLVHISDPGPGFDWRKQLRKLADVNVSIENQNLLASSGRGISITLAGARGVLWNEAGNEVTLRFRPRGAPEAISHPPPPIELIPTSPEQQEEKNEKQQSSEPRLAYAPTTPRFPSHNPPKRRRSSSSTRRIGPAGLSEAKVLVVDDIEINCRVLQRMLEWDGYLVKTASDGPSAIEVIEQWKPDVVVMDVNMPRMSGIETVRVLQKRNLLKDTAVMLLTAASVGDDMRSEGLEAGACDFLEKPISRRELIARVRRRIETLQDKRAVEVERDGMRSSVDAAGAVMQALMPDPVVLVNEARIQSLVLPCEAVGGDVVSIIQSQDGDWAVLLFDVAGHGIAAALTASAARAVVQEKLMERMPLSEALQALNRQLNYDFDRTGQHAAVSGVWYDAQRRVVEVVNAGNPPVALWTRDGRQHSIKSNAPPAGLVEGVKYQAKSFLVESVERVIVVSDGITESVSSSSDTLGALRIICNNAVEAFESLPEPEIRKSIEKMGKDRDDVSIAWIDFVPNPQA